MRNNILVHKWINGDLTDEELEAFRKTEEYNELQEIYTLSDHLRAPELDKENILSQIIQSSKGRSTENKASQKGNLFKFSMAAALAAMILFSFIAYNYFSMEVITSEMAQTKKGILPDDSEYVLNAESSIRYSERKWNSERHLFLQGEAYFSVIDGSMFRVETDRGIVEVLGTKFNVRNRSGKLSVSCFEGQVSVVNANFKIAKILDAGEGLKIDERGQIVDFATSSTSSWLTGSTYLKDAKLIEVVAEIKRQYNIDVNVSQKIGSQKITTEFTHDDIEAALKAITIPLSLEYERDSEGNVRIY